MVSKLTSCSVCLIISAMVALIAAPQLLLAYWYWIDYARWNPLGGPPETYVREENYLVDAAGKPSTTFSRWEKVGIRFKYFVHRDSCDRQTRVYVADVTGDYREIEFRPKGSTQGLGNDEREYVYTFRPRDEPGPQKVSVRVYYECNPLRKYLVHYLFEYEAV